MRRDYTVQQGDTFARIARREYGTPDRAGLIRQANPGASEPLQPGITLTLPSTGPEPTEAESPARERDEVAITVDGERFRFWESVRLTRSIDKPDDAGFTAPFEPDDEQFRRTFRPFSYKPMSVSVGGETLFTGTLVGVDPTVQGDRLAVSVNGYASPGVLQDCAPPASAWPIEQNGLDLRELAAKLAEPFGIPVQFMGDPGPPFERQKPEPVKKILDFLKPLAQQRGFIISSTAEGFLLFWRSVEPGQPRAVLRQGESPVTSVTPNFQPQEYYSAITGLTPTQLGDTGQSYTARNPHLDGVLRPSVFQFRDAESGDVETATRAKLGRMFGNMVSYSVEVSTWRDPQGRLWEPNTTVKLIAPNAMVYQEYELIVRSVSFERDAEQKTAALELVLPGAFSGETPETLPWDG